jgi:hypothetical protein
VSSWLLLGLQPLVLSAGGHTSLYEERSQVASLYHSENILRHQAKGRGYICLHLSSISSLASHPKFLPPALLGPGRKHGQPRASGAELLFKSRLWGGGAKATEAAELLGNVMGIFSGDSQPETILPPRGQVAISTHFIAMSGGRRAADIYWVDPRDAARYP